MKTPYLLLGLIGLGLSASAARGQSFAGEYADKNYHSGNAVFEMSLEGSGNNTEVWFSAIDNDGLGAAPEGKGIAHPSGKDTLEFSFEDSCGNSGTGTIKHSGNDIVVSIKPSHVADARCVKFYGTNFKLTRAKK